MIGDVVVLLGGPGAGKGTQADILADRLGLAHVATGDMFRAAVAEGTPLGRAAKEYMDRGELVPDEVTIEMLFERLAEPDAELGILLDGFPRTVAQAQVLGDELAKHGARVSAVPYIEVPEEELVRRLSGRWTCRAEGHTYNEQTKPPAVPGVCDVDGSELYQRTDDQPQTVKARLSQQLGVLNEVVQFYRAQNVLAPVDGSRSIDAVTEGLMDALESILSKEA